LLWSIPTTPVALIPLSDQAAAAAWADLASREAGLALGDRATPALRRLLAGRLSPEARRRAEQLLARPDHLITDPEMLRGVRAVEVLERLATPDARQVLVELAGGDTDSRLTREAKSSLERLNRRP
jgi:hypothetical protein